MGQLTGMRGILELRAEVAGQRNAATLERGEGARCVG